MQYQCYSSFDLPSQDFGPKCRENSQTLFVRQTLHGWRLLQAQGHTHAAALTLAPLVEKLLQDQDFLDPQTSLGVLYDYVSGLAAAGDLAAIEHPTLKALELANRPGADLRAKDLLLPILADHYQQAGNYSAALDTLLGMHTDLIKRTGTALCEESPEALRLGRCETRIGQLHETLRRSVLGHKWYEQAVYRLAHHPPQLEEALGGYWRCTEKAGLYDSADRQMRLFLRRGTALYGQESETCFLIRNVLSMSHLHRSDLPRTAALVRDNARYFRQALAARMNHALPHLMQKAVLAAWEEDLDRAVRFTRHAHHMEARHGRHQFYPQGVVSAISRVAGRLQESCNVELALRLTLVVQILTDDQTPDRPEGGTLHRDEEE